VSLPASAEVINARRSRVFLTETTTPFHAAVVALLAPEILTTSEYFGDQYASGDYVGDIRHEDLQQTSFPDEYFDFVITSDVMEHVPDAIAAEREIVRILSPGGAYCFTVPLLAYAEADMIAARVLADGSIEYLEEPMYHGDPLRPEGALVFRLFSVNEMTARFAALGVTCTTYRIWSKSYGILGPGCWVHVVRKPNGRAVERASARV
jgi:SAM-dependent methyltransferase